MPGDGGMTSCTPEFHGDPADGAVSFMRTLAAEYGCGVREIPSGSIVRLRFPYLSGRRNPLTQCLRRFGVWGQSCAEKHLPDELFSRDFWIGCLSGLIDTDGHVRERRNPKGTVHSSVEYATVSPVLARQVADALLRLGVTSTHRVIERFVSGTRRPGSKASRMQWVMSRPLEATCTDTTIVSPWTESKTSSRPAESASSALTWGLRPCSS
ncbi:MULTISPECIES: LAGLIDADG family homing endonuclease [unclassified Streptomyces]|uniref:LAGLIDADG family homing endonuclease n=1 Tax=unclassified Streptomyces TaxID=2593676 RepID=UPI0035DB60BC